MRQRVMRSLVLALPVVGAVAAVAIQLSRVPWPSAEFWAERANWIVWAIICAGLIPAVQTAISELGEKKRRKALEQEARIRTLLASSLVVLVRDCQAPFDLTGVQAFFVTGYLWRVRQERVAKLRLSPAPTSGVTWTKGKGVISLCWDTRSAQIVNLDEAPFSKLASTPEYQWPMVDTRTRFGLSFQEYRAVGDKYGTVAAVPIFGSSGKYVGCVTFDLPPGLRLSNPHRALESLATTAQLVPVVVGL